ncbi:MAG: DUF2914 domain-containing protein [Candidatus Pacebacteria bacterium]|nr:DUF2914 domain-containing protein [Candidatus Paceibacterota bacterium]
MTEFEINQDKTPLVYRLKRSVQHHWLTLAFIGGFVTDFILLNQVDNFFDNLVLFFYVALASAALVVFYASLTERFGGRFASKIHHYSAIAMQYAFGGLFSGMLIFYGRSSDPLASWPYLLIIALVIAGNELLKERGKRLIFNLTAYFVGVFSYIAFVIPVITGWIGPWVFMISGVLALALVAGVVRLLQHFIPRYLELQMRMVVFSVLGAFAIFQGMYWSNIIPPIPLSLNELSVVHSVSRSTVSSTYTISYERTSWWNLVAWWRPTLHIGNTGTAACFSSVFAPAKMTVEVFHVWEKYNEETKAWEERFRVEYPISGEARTGYRGYSQSNTATAGKWRCTVKTGRGQVLGHRVFYIDTSSRTMDLETRVE